MRDGDTTTIERDVPSQRSDVDVPVETSGGASQATTQPESRRARLRSRVGSLFSLRQFGLGLVASLAGLLVVGGLLPFGSLGDLVGLASGAFVHGLLSSRRRYAEAALAGATVALGATLLDHFALTVFGLGLPVVTVGLLGGAVAGGVGHYFGRDLRDGLTRDL